MPGTQHSFSLIALRTGTGEGARNVKRWFDGTDRRRCLSRPPQRVAAVSVVTAAFILLAPVRGHAAPILLGHRTTERSPEVLADFGLLEEMLTANASWSFPAPVSDRVSGEPVSIGADWSLNFDTYGESIVDVVTGKELSSDEAFFFHPPWPIHFPVSDYSDRARRADLSTPEPTSISLALCGLTTVAGYCGRRRSKPALRR